mmetsp:Transcript_120605/g.336528  ORF Transcript_120605/g.336528 Transcript_120605/m.336528 type:complete len:277 (+) Transcript_120605:79-909(+)
MLHLRKNKIVTGVAKQQVEIRQLEVDWYCGNYSTITVQAAMLSGFAFTQLTTPMPDDYEPPFMLEFGYLFLTCMAIGLELSAIILSTFLSVWGPSLALRGRAGAADLHRAVDCLRDYQLVVFLYFIIGWLIFFVSSILQVWIYFKRRVAVVVTFPLSLFIAAIAWYSFDITRQLRLNDRDAVAGKVDHLQAYDFVGDLDHGLHSTGLASGQRARARDGGYCPINETRGDTVRQKQFASAVGVSRPRHASEFARTASASDIAAPSARPLRGGSAPGR